MKTRKIEINLFDLKLFLIQGVRYSLKQDNDITANGFTGQVKKYLPLIPEEDRLLLRDIIVKEIIKELEALEMHGIELNQYGTWDALLIWLLNSVS